MDLQELLENINAIRGHRAHVTNAFLTRPQISELLEKDGTRVVSRDGLLLLVQEGSRLIRLYFYAASYADLARICDLIRVENRPVILDIVGRDPGAKTLGETLQDNGFELYSTFVRMTCDAPRIPKREDTWAVEYAEDEDVDAIVELLGIEFDILFAHIPPADDIRAAVKKREITVVRVDGKLAGFAFFQRTSPRNVCLRYFMVRVDFRSQGIGSALLANAFTHHGEGTKYVLWVGTYNTALRMYESLNFRCDGMVDYILRLKGSHDEHNLRNTR